MFDTRKHLDYLCLKIDDEKFTIFLNAGLGGY